MEGQSVNQDMDEIPGSTFDQSLKLQLDSSNSESDDEPVVVRKKIGKKCFLIDSDEEDNDEPDQNTLQTESSPIATTPLNGVNSLDTMDEEMNTNMRRVESDGDGVAGGEIAADSVEIAGIHMKSPNSHPSASKILDTDSEDDDVPLASVTKKPTRLLPDDLYDDEMDDSEDEGTKHCGESDEESPHNRLDSKGEDSCMDSDEEENAAMSAILKKRLAKGAGKKAKAPKTPRVPRPKKEEIQQIHSESQRLMRESDVQLPYHIPVKRGLSDFLAKAKQKQETFQKIKAKGLHWKNSPELAILGKSESKLSPAVEVVPAVETVIVKHVECKISLDTPQPTPASVSDPTVTKSVPEFDLDEDDLPDLVIETEERDYNVDLITSKTTTNSVEKDANMVHTELTPDGGGEESDMINVKIAESVNTKMDKEPKIEHDSGYITTPAVSEEENSGDSSHTSPVKEMDSGQAEQPATPDHRQMAGKTHLTPKLAGLSVIKTVTPKLSGTLQDVIDLDEDDAQVTPKTAPGVEKLMERFLKHSSHAKKAKLKDVELSTVQKEIGTDGKEELKLDKFTYHINIDEEDDARELHKPGAKLLKLKEKLAEKMKEKRQVARKEKEDYAMLDNEDIDEDIVLDDEAELTDQTDTDNEEEEDIDEEDIINEELEEEEETKEANPFLEDEAEVDDEDQEMESDYDDEGLEQALHLELEEEEKGKEKCQKYMKKAWQKQKTFDLFDEDANTESPTISQSTNSDTAGTPVSDRPFEQLSGNTVKLDDDDDETMNLLDMEDSAKTNSSSIQFESESTEGSSLSVNKEKSASFHSADSSFDFMGSMIPAAQSNLRKQSTSRDDTKTPDLFTPSSKTSTSILSKSCSKTSEFSLPIEDSQFLLNSNSGFPMSQAESTPRNENFSFNIDDETQSQMLDDDGLLTVKSSEKKSSRRQLLMENSVNENMDELLELCSGKFTGGTQSENTQANMDELLGLCSGQFSETQNTQKSQGKKALFEESDSSDAPASQNMRELLGLCSGQFTGEFSVSSQNVEQDPDSPVKLSKKKRKGLAIIEDDGESNDSFGMVSGGEEEDIKEALDSDEEIEEDLDEEEEIQRKEMTGLFNKKGKLQNQFVDEEAALSSEDEPDSDEDWDLEEKDDIMEREAGDDEEHNEDELRNQVGRVHLKNLIDDDAKEIRLMKEMLLPDGDLYSEGGGRQRKFRWRNADDEDTQADLFDNSGDEGDGLEENEEEATWRKQRYEREKFLEEQKESQKEGEDEQKSSQIKMGRATFQLKKTPITSKSKPVLVSSKTTNMGPPPAPSPKRANTFKLKGHGSFLRRSKDTLAKIAEMTKPVGNVAGPRNSRGFVFTTLDQAEKEQQVEKTPQVKRSSSIDGKQQPPAKRPKLDRSNTMPSGSIFNLF